MIKKMRGKERERGKGKKRYATYAFSIKRQMPCVTGGENEHNLIPFCEGGRDARGKGKHNEAEREAERGKAKCLSSRPKKGGIRRCV